MTKVSVVIPVYNEIRFIEKTLQSVIGEADEIILCDNASTDGTSDICARYAAKYPEIKYTRHTENMGASANFNYSIAQATGKYIRLIGAHDMVSRFSTQNMLSIIENDTNIGMVYSKYIAMLKPDYSIYKLYAQDEFGNALEADNPFLRVQCIVETLSDCTLYYGLYNAELLRKISNEHKVFNFISDHTCLANAASKAKIVADNRSIFFRMEPREPEQNYYLQAERIAKSITAGKCQNPYLWPFAVLCEQYGLIKEMQLWEGAPDNFATTLQDTLIKRFGCVDLFEITMKGMPEILPDKQALCDEVFQKILEYKALQCQKCQKRQKKMKQFKYRSRYMLYKHLKYFNDKGIGKKLYARLEKKLKKAGLIN